MFDILIPIIFFYGGLGERKIPGNSLQYFAFKDVNCSVNDTYSNIIPFIMFFMYKLMFAIIAAPSMTGAFANRLTVSGWIKVLIPWTMLIYCPVAN